MPEATNQPGSTRAANGRPLLSTDRAPSPVSRAVALLKLLVEAGEPLGVTQLAGLVDLPTSTVHRLLQLLRAEGLVVSLESRTYGIGPELQRISGIVVGGMKLPELAAPFVKGIAHKFDETVLFGEYMRTHGSLMFTVRADGAQLLKYEIEMFRPLSLLWGASGKAVLAYLDESEIGAILENESPSPGKKQPLPKLCALLETLAEVRRNGYAVTQSEKLPGARGIAAPVFNAAGVVGSICLTSPEMRTPNIGVVKIAREVMRQARELSRSLGAPLQGKPADVL